MSILSWLRRRRVPAGGPSEPGAGGLEGLLALIAAVESSLPLDRTRIEALLGVELRPVKAHGRRSLETTAPVGPNRFGVSLAGVQLAEPASDEAGSLAFGLAGECPEQRLLEAAFPGGHPVPPPPEPWAHGTGSSYVVDRPWGRMWLLAWAAPPQRLRGISFEIGAHGSPGV